MEKAPGAMTPASYRPLMYSMALRTSSFVRSGCPSLIMLPPVAQTQDMTSFWMPLGCSRDRGNTQP